MAHTTMRQRVSRSLTLLRAFVGLSALILVLGGLVLGTILTRALRDQALADAKVSLTQSSRASASTTFSRSTHPSCRSKDR